MTTKPAAPGDEVLALRLRLVHVNEDATLALHELITGRIHAAKKALYRAIKESNA